MRKKFIKFCGAVITSLFLLACEQIENEDGPKETLCLKYYEVCVSPLLNTEFNVGMNDSCANAACHLIGSGSGGAFQVEDTGNIDSFNSAMGMVDLFTPSNSLLLTKPSDPTHGGNVFPELAPGSVCYSQIREWMDTVVTDQPANQRPNDPCAAMPVCSVVNATAC